MAKETVYNNTLVSGAADETLTYTRYVKDESSGKSTKELLDEKVNKTDQLKTTQIADNAVTTDKLADESVTADKLDDGAVTVDKIADSSVDTAKIKENAVTNEKLADQSVDNSKIGDSAVDGRTIQEGVVQTEHLANESVTNAKIATDSISRDKLDPSIRKELADTISAANASTSKADQATEDAKNATAAATAAKEAADNATKLATNATTASNQATELAKDATTKADDATARANEAAQKADDSREQTEQTLGTMQEVIDKVAIKDDEGTMVETPFRYIQSEEFIFAKVDANNKLLFGIQWDGTPVFGKTSAVENRLQSQVNLLAERVATIMGDDDTTNVIDTMNELKNFFAEIENTQTLTSILANLNSLNTKFGEDIKNLQDTKVDKEEGKSLIEDEVKECFRVIENEEFLKAIVDSDDKVLFGFYRATGEPYYPLNEMYHVIQNEEYFAVWLDAANHVLLGIRRDGEIIGEIHAVNALKKVISQLQADLASLQEKVGTIDTNLKELLDVFSLQENPEYMAVETDAKGKILSATNPDGSHYIHNAKSETIPTEFNHIEDPEGRTEITTDAENKILGYRDSEGTRHEHKISANHINLSDEAAKEVNEAFMSAGIKMENPSDFSKDSYVELPIPRIAAQVRLYAPKLPTTKQDNIEAEIEYNDKDGNYFRKPVILNAQGSSSINYYVKNMAIDLNDGSEIKFGDFPTQDSFHLKKYYIDAFRGQCIVGYWLMEQVYKSRPIGQQYPYEYLNNNESITTGNGKVKTDFFNGAKCHPDGFPIVVTWVDYKGEETNMGIYAWNLKKSKEVYNADKKNVKNIILDGVLGVGSLFDNVWWGGFEIRNPKSLVDINGDKYNGDNPKELSDTDKNSKQVKDYIVRLSGAKAALQVSKTKETFEQYFLVEPFIDYFLVSQVLFHHDGFSKNWIWCTWDGLHWCPTLYDVDSIFGMYWNGCFIIPDSAQKDVLEGTIGSNESPTVLGMEKIYTTEIQERYAELRGKAIFSVDNIHGLLTKWLKQIGYDNIEKEVSIYPQTPSYRKAVNENWEIQYYKYPSSSEVSGYSDTTQYNEGDLCEFHYFVFKALKNVTGVCPLDKTYDLNPNFGGFYNSPRRVYNWLYKRFEFLDNMYNYKK